MIYANFTEEIDVTVLRSLSILKKKNTKDCGTVSDFFLFVVAKPVVRQKTCLRLLVISFVLLILPYKNKYFDYGCAFFYLYLLLQIKKSLK